MSEGDENVCLKEMRTFAASKPMAHTQDSQNMVKLLWSETDETWISAKQRIKHSKISITLCIIMRNRRGKTRGLIHYGILILPFRFGALKSDSTHHFFRNACTKSGSLRFSQFSGC